MYRPADSVPSVVVGACRLQRQRIESLLDPLVGAWMLNPDASPEDLELPAVVGKHCSALADTQCAPLRGTLATASACKARLTAVFEVQRAVTDALADQRLLTPYEDLVRVRIPGVY